MTTTQIDTIRAIDTLPGHLGAMAAHLRGYCDDRLAPMIAALDAADDVRRQVWAELTAETAGDDLSPDEARLFGMTTTTDAETAWTWARMEQGYEGSLDEWLAMSAEERQDYEDGAQGIGTA